MFILFFFFFKQKTAYELRISDWSSDVCSSDLLMTQQLDPITVEVVRNKLEGIANEMQMTLFHSSFSPIVREGLDASASLFTVDGETLAQAVAIPIHLATLIPVVKRIIQEFPLDTMRDGDVYKMNRSEEH